MFRPQAIQRLGVGGQVGEGEDGEAPVVVEHMKWAIARLEEKSAHDS